EEVVVGAELPGDALDGVGDGEEVDILGEHRGGELLQRGDVGDPDAAAVGADDEVLLPGLDHDVVNSDAGDVVVHALPMRAAIERDVHAGIVAQKYEIGVHGILGDDVHRRGGQSGGDGRPGGAVVVGAEDIGGEVVKAVAALGEIGASGDMGGGAHPADVGIRPSSSGGHVGGKIGP